MSDTKRPTVSVIIPAYNHARFLAEALDSVVAQRLQDFEVVVVDDGSTDETRALVASYAPRVRYHFQPHAGVSRARNTGLRHTSAPYVAFLDADDTWAPDKLAQQVSYLDAHPQVGVVFTNYLKIDEAGRLLGEEPKRFPYSRSPFENMLIWPYGSMNVAMVRRACLQRVGDFDETLTIAEDWDLWLRVARHYGIANVDQPLATYRQSARSASRGPGRSQAPTMFRQVVDKLFADPGRLAGLPPKTVERLRCRAYGSLEITIALMLLGSPWRHLCRATRLSPAVVWLRRRAVAFLILRGLARLGSANGGHARWISKSVR